MLLFSGCGLFDSSSTKESVYTGSIEKECTGEHCDQKKSELSDLSSPMVTLSPVFFDNKTEGLPRAKPMKEVRIFDGEEFELTAEYVQDSINNTPYKRMAYNQQIPGPALVVTRGSEITIKYTNKLDIPTTFSPPMNAVSEEGQTHKAILPGESALYTLRFSSEGIFWYQSLLRRDYTQEMGLMGTIRVVSPPTEEYWYEVQSETTLVLDDFLTNTPFFPEVVDHALSGRKGDVLFINNSEDTVIGAETGDVVRFFLANASNGRSFGIRFGENKTKLVGGDYGRIEEEYILQKVSLAPGERRIVEVFFDKPGDVPITHEGTIIGTLSVSEKKTGIPDDIEQMNMEDLEPLKNFGGLRKYGKEYGFFRSQSEIYEKELPEKQIHIEPEVDEENLISQYESATEEKNPDEALNTAADSNTLYWIVRDSETRKKNQNIDWQFKSGDLVKIRIDNSIDTQYPADHVLHIDGQRFLVLEKDGKAPHNWQWQDTIKVSKGQVVDILVLMEYAGKGALISRIPEHQHTGVMVTFTVDE
jgi:suppressor of ftsI